MERGKQTRVTKPVKPEPKPVHILTLAMNPSELGGPYVFSYTEYGELIKANPVETLEGLRQLVRTCYQTSLHGLKPLVIAVKKDSYHAGDSSVLFKIASEALREAVEEASGHRPVLTKSTNAHGKTKDVFVNKHCPSAFQVVSPKVIYLTSRQMGHDVLGLPKHRKILLNNEETFSKMKKVAEEGFQESLDRLSYLVPITCFGYWAAFRSKEVECLLQPWLAKSATYGY